MSKSFKNSQKTASQNPIPNNKPFKKGVSGNPSGRPKGSRNRSTIVREWLETKLNKINPITGNLETLDIQDHMVIAMIGKALDGDINAFKELFDSGHGKITDRIQTEHKTELDIDLSKEEARKIITKLKEEI